jgi:hypothetical protein
MSYLTQFPADYAPPTHLVSLLEQLGWTDESWGNDVCPRWCHVDMTNNANWSLWIDHPNPDSREFGSSVARYTVCDAMDTVTFQSEDTDAIAAYLMDLANNPA